MSPRYQVFIIEKLKGKEERIGTLYHHFDGYPERMVPMLNEAIKKWKNEAIKGFVGRNELVNYIIAEDPARYEIGSINEKIRPDTVYLYKISLRYNGKTGKWLVQVKTINRKGIKMRLR
jgi:hypothetical protein